MPGYGIAGPEQGRGLLPWSWAEERLAAARNYWVASTWPDGRPHVMPVWGIWDGGMLWFSSAIGSRKARNLAADPRCVVTTEHAAQPVIVEGTVELVADPAERARFLSLSNAKYRVAYGDEMIDPATIAVMRLRPVKAIALDDDSFNDTPTRWTF
jgi:PPOX class probable F420-dependent enzyme